MPIDSRIEAHIRPRFVELLRMSTTEEMDAVAQRYFTRLDSQLKREGKDGVTHLEFWHQFGIDVRQYSNFYAEVGGSSAIRGPYFPSNKVRPILTIQRSRSGMTWKIVSQSCTGFFSQNLERAWVPVDVYEKMLSDTFYDELQEKADKIQKAQARQEERDERAQKKKDKK
jgi:hypothetical protein